MPKYKIIADPRVKNDLLEAKNFLNTRRKGYGNKFLAEYKNTLKHLLENPNYQIRYHHIHCLPLKKFKYMVHFSLDNNEFIVHVYAVLSTYLDPDNHYIKP